MYIEMVKKLLEFYKEYKAGKKGEALVKNSGKVIENMITQAQAGEAKIFSASVVNQKRIGDLENRQLEYNEAMQKANRIIGKLQELFE